MNSISSPGDTGKFPLAHSAFRLLDAFLREETKCPPDVPWPVERRAADHRETRRLRRAIVMRSVGRNTSSWPAPKSVARHIDFAGTT